jgi:uncharacterized membrane protein
LKKFDSNRNAANALRTVSVILAVIVIVILTHRGTAWYMATVLGFGVLAVLATLALLLDPTSRKPKG